MTLTIIVGELRTVGKNESWGRERGERIGSGPRERRGSEEKDIIGSAGEGGGRERLSCDDSEPDLLVILDLTIFNCS